MHTATDLSRGKRTYRGFTLIELLVVVAIITLLVSILVRSLALARIRAMITSDAANSKQIGTAMAMYQSTDNGNVPIMLNWHSGPAYHAPARAVFLSVALRQGEKSLAGLARRHLPAHYVCPFQRGRQPWDLEKRGTGPAGLTQYEWSGVMESYQTWLWEDVVRGQKVYNEPNGWGNKYNGLPKYSVLTWNQIKSTGKGASDKAIQNTLHRKWNAGKTGSLSELTVAYCAIGEHMEMGSRRIDVGSHRTTSGGGTNAIFADTHVEWVIGTRIGWP